MEFFAGAAWGLTTGFLIHIVRTSPETDDCAEDAFRWSPHDVLPARWNVIGRLREAVIAHASKRDDRP